MDSIDDWVERSISEWKTTFNERIARARCRKLIEEIVTYIRDRVRPVGQIDTLNREIRNLKREVHGLNQRNRSLKMELEQLREQVSGYQNQQRTLEVENNVLAERLQQTQQSNSNRRLRSHAP
ncbi:uncharacterized protein LOC126691049 [Quercus robur]|uniref:uncharacterized protein LOC126691049 n=1 Tax=Quercus robur TaxID=38942 RepID=UPI002162259A|nr:uncharacterized protein LOC126691049 [Quercus robur]